MHNNILNRVLARLLRITTPKRHQKDISAHIVFQDNIVCVAEFIHIQHKRRLHKLHIFDWPFADFGCLSPASLIAAAHYLEEQLQQAEIICRIFCFVLPSNQITSRQSTLPFSSLTALKKANIPIYRSAGKAIFSQIICSDWLSSQSPSHFTR